MEKLFSSSAEYLDFLNAIAYRRVKNLKKENDTFQAEVNSAVEKCGILFQSNGAEANYITEIIDIEDKITDAERKNLSSTDIGELSLKRESLYNKYNKFLGTLPLEVKEDIEFNFKKIVDRRLRIAHTNEIITQITTEFPNSLSIDFNSISSQPIFKKINGFLKPQTMEVEDEKESEPVKEEVKEEMPYVVKIEMANDSLVDNKELEEEPEEEISAADLTFETDNSFYDPEDTFTSQVENEVVVPSFKTVVEEEIPTEDIKTIDDTVTFKLEQGISLADMATVIYNGDISAWHTLYKANKSIIDERLKERECLEENVKFMEETPNDIPPFVNDINVLDGITIVIPNEYEKSNEHTLAKAA